MGIIRGEIMQSLGPLHVIDFSYPTPDETLLGTPITLTDAEPVTPTFSYTIGVGHLGTLTGSYYSYTNCLNLYFAGINNGASSLNVYYTVKLNSSTIYTGSLSVEAGYYWTVSFVDPDTTSVVIGDVIDVYLHSDNATDMDFDYKACVAPATAVAIYPDVSLVNKISNVVINISSVYPNSYYPLLTLGNPYRSSGGTTTVQNIRRSTSGSSLSLTSDGQYVLAGLWQCYSIWPNVLRWGFGDATTSVRTRTSATNRPYFYCTLGRVTNFSYYLTKEN